MAIGQIRRVLSTTFVRAQALCLLSRVSQLGPGARSANDRRVLAQRLEQGRARERSANYWAHIRGRGVKFGDIFN